MNKSSSYQNHYNQTVRPNRNDFPQASRIDAFSNFGSQWDSSSVASGSKTKPRNEKSGRDFEGFGHVGLEEEHESSNEDKETQFPDEEVVLSMAKRVGLNKVHSILLLLLDNNHQ